MEEFFQEKEIHLSDYLIVLMKRRAVIIGFLVTSLSLTLLFTFVSTPIYQSTAKLIIDREKTASPITGEQVDYENYMSQSMTFNTHFKLIKSLPVIEKVIRVLKLDSTEELEVNPFFTLLNTMKSNMKLLFQLDDREVNSTGEHLALVMKIQSKIEIKPVRETRLLTIKVMDKDPKLAADMANTLAKSYVEFDMASKMASSKRTLEWLNNELYSLRKNLEDAERAFFDYKQQNKVFSISGKQKMTEQKIEEFNTRYLEARNRRLEVDAKINELTRHIQGTQGIAMVRSLVNNPMIDTIYAKIVDLELEHTRLSKVFKKKHPKIVQLIGEMAKSRARLSEEIKKDLGNLKSERKVLMSREKNLEKNISKFETDALDTSAKELKYTILKRNVNTSQNLYDLMVSRVKESNILQTSDSSNIRLVERAQVAVEPISPNKLRNLALALALGLFGGTGLAFFMEYLDRSIRTEEDIIHYFNMPVLSVIPDADDPELKGGHA